MAAKHHNKAKKKGSQKREVSALSTTPATLHKLPRPKKFNSTSAVCDYAKYSVYQITRIRNGQSVTMGTGFLAAKNRMITCAHCINNPEQPKEPMAHHKDGDVYCLLQLDEDNNAHYAFIAPNMGAELFVYPVEDIAVIYLPDNFYGADGDYYQHPDRFLELTSKRHGIGTDIVILGYPLEQLRFSDEGMPQIGSVLLRGDSGVVNTRYLTDGGDSTQIEIYQFTTPFIPGNSGGPIIDRNTGKVLGIVKGYISVPVRQVEDPIEELDGKGKAIVSMQKSIVKTTYSIGFSMANCAPFADEHGLTLLT